MAYNCAINCYDLKELSDVFEGPNTLLKAFIQRIWNSLRRLEARQKTKLERLRVSPDAPWKLAEKLSDVDEHGSVGFYTSSLGLEGMINLSCRPNLLFLPARLELDRTRIH